MLGAIAAYRSAIESGNITYLPDAAIMLGDLMERNGDITAARDAYNQALVPAMPRQNSLPAPAGHRQLHLAHGLGRC